MKRRYDYKCLECSKVFEISHEVSETIITIKCPVCKKVVPVERQLSAAPFKINWDTNY